MQRWPIRVDGLRGLVLDVHDHAGIVRDLKALAVVGNGAVAARQAFNAMPERMLGGRAVLAAAIDRLDSRPPLGLLIAQFADATRVE